MEKKAMTDRLIRFWHAWGKTLLITLLLVTSFRSAVADWNDVPTGSMKPTILEGDRIFVNKLAYDLRVPYTSLRLARWAEPRRGELVVFFSPVDGTRLVKRVVGVPGDEIALSSHRLLVNGETATYEPAGKVNGVFRFTETLAGSHRAVQFTAGSPAADSFPPMTLPRDTFFMMGDNRCNSADSRVFGPVSMDRIVGRVGTVVLSVDPDAWYQPRWDRFLFALK